jgi:SAM-dependent methyltransferase
MNAIEIPLADESVDTVLANSVLHLISSPEKVVREIYRVLKKGGVFVCRDDAPSKTPETPFDNSLYFEIVNSIYSEYWNRLNAQGIYAKKYSWKFDRNAFCDRLFIRRVEKSIEQNQPYEIPLKDGFLPRFTSRGFSDQVDVPKDLQDEIITGLLQVFKEKYGESFVDISLKGLEQDMLITMYYKLK